MRKLAWLSLAASVVLVLLASLTGLTMMSDFKGLLSEGPGAVADFKGAGLSSFHQALAYIAVAACCLFAAICFVLGIGSLLSGHRFRAAAAMLCFSAPVVVTLSLFEAVSGHGRWEDAHLGELQPELLESFARIHGLRLPGGLLLGLLIAGVCLVLVSRARAEATDE